MDTPDPIPLSALQHWRYCPRQCALIHLEQAFEENIHTLRGQAVHARVDQPGVEVRAGLWVERALPVFSDRLGLIGKADVVGFLADGTPYPVEYKHGTRNKKAEIAACDDLQLAPSRAASHRKAAGQQGNFRCGRRSNCARDDVSSEAAAISLIEGQLQAAGGTS